MLFGRKSVLDEVSVAAPCPAKWDDMVGDDRVRLCAGCSQNVYNISEMSIKEAELFLSENSGSKCLRLYRRNDGTLITKDCPIGRKIIDGFKRRIGFAAAAFITVFNAAVSFAQVPQLKLPEKILVVEGIRDVMGGTSHDSGIIDERHYTNRPERRKNTKQENLLGPDVSAINAFISARSYEQEKNFREAEKNYELAISAFRNSKTTHDKKFVNQVAKKYDHFLRNLKQKDRAKSIENEFCKRSTSGHAVRRQKTSPTLPEGAPIPDSQKK